ncbi:MAG: Helix-turn-helix domain protein [Pelotomaculum sp. PtaU1.Bin035]|nr:MAG: Helix-turn-helix domain protein [Pelotomaculum sp. PtaU1.Bin035]
MTAKEAAGYIGVSYWLLLELVKKRQIPAIHAGRRVLFRRNSLDQWMSNQEANCTLSEEFERGRIRRVQ